MSTHSSFFVQPLELPRGMRVGHYDRLGAHTRVIGRIQVQKNCISSLQPRPDRFNCRTQYKRLRSVLITSLMWKFHFK